MSQDTIAAVATPPGSGGVGIVRVSGPACRAIATALLGNPPAPRHATLCDFRDAGGGLIDTGLALYFPAPHSFTGEDVLELQGHGGAVVMDMLLGAVLAAGARMARPGEFSERAFLNDKLDLAQAEAIADLIESGSTQAARAALRSLQGEFSARIDALREAMVELRMYVEAAIDFPEEEVDFLADSHVAEKLDGLFASLADIEAGARQGCLLREGMRVVLAGRPNAGKSSLLNALAGTQRAIVTDVPGTTRDVLHSEINLAGMPLHVIDTAGLREGGDAIEAEGMRRARAEIETADRILLVVDESRGFGADEVAIIDSLPAAVPLIIVHNKIDLVAREAGREKEAGREHVYLSAREGAGLADLRACLAESMGFHAGAEGAFSARRRHLDALARTRACLEAGRAALQEARAGELLAEDLRLAQQCLGEITGEFTSDDLLGEIFSRFCIGK
ncbi:MAG TPA: tRNA uridine-5-carboxymethylaminomethyl(34) synthesis GTPase MnmE [Gammaproteobacteria bacterium]|nr:tRNA uridine-5-carboxymethylaminomethyl(34) synthesis GTPase MnmE [Gammaproteobacteria bacterium]